MSRCHYARRMNERRQTTEDRATQPMEAGFRNLMTNLVTSLVTNLSPNLMQGDQRSCETISVGGGYSYHRRQEGAPHHALFP